MCMILQLWVCVLYGIRVLKNRTLLLCDSRECLTLYISHDTFISVFLRWSCGFCRHPGLVHLHRVYLSNLKDLASFMSILVVFDIHTSAYFAGSWTCTPWVYRQYNAFGFCFASMQSRIRMRCTDIGAWSHYAYQAILGVGRGAGVSIVAECTYVMARPSLQETQESCLQWFTTC